MRVKGQAALYLAATIFAFVTLCVKLAAPFYAGPYLSAWRFLIGALLCVAALTFGFPRTRPKSLGTVLLRGLFGAFSMIASYAAITLTGPGRATLLSNLYPVFVAVFGAVFFGERFKVRSLGSLLLCVAGAVLVVRDGSGAALAGDLLALASALLAGLAVNFVRRASALGENPFILYLSPCLFGLPMFAFAPAPAAGGGLVGVALLLAVGVGAFAAQALMAYGYRSVSAGEGSIVFFWETALTVLLGLLFGGEVLNWRFALGLAVIVAGLWLNREAPRRGATDPAVSPGRRP